MRMNKKIAVLSIIVFLFVLIVGVFASNKEAKADTNVSGNITSNTTWTLVNSPYIVTDTVQVLEGVTLTIQPGVTVKFNSNKSLSIGGKLIARGTENNKITFTSNQSSPQIGDWDGILFTDGSIDASVNLGNNYLDGSIIEYSIYEYADNLRINDSSPYIGNNTFRNNEYAVIFSASNSIFKNNTVENNSNRSIYLHYSNSKIIGNTIKNSNVAFEISMGSPEITSNLIQDNYSGFYLTFSANPIIQYNNIINSGTDGRTLWLGQNSNVTATYNYWGTINSTEIDEIIHDYYDNLSLGKVNYNPYALGMLTFTGNDQYNICSKPITNIAGGSYTSNQSVTLSTTTVGATIHYTTDGSVPTASSTVYSSALSISGSTTLKAIAVKSGMTDSETMSETYIISVPETVATPTVSPAGGTYTSNESVTLSTTTSGATIYYTTNGSTPTTSSATYSSPLSISNTTTLKAIAIKSGMIDSTVMSETFTISNDSNNNNNSNSNSNNNSNNSDKNNTTTPQVTASISTLNYSTSKKAKTRISYTFTNLSLTKKKYVTMRIGNKKVKVTGVRRSGNDSIVTVELKYGRWPVGNYNLAMSYKNKTKIAYTKKGKTKYRNGWERGSVSQNSILQIL